MVTTCRIWHQFILEKRGRDDYSDNVKVEFLKINMAVDLGRVIEIVWRESRNQEWCYDYDSKEYYRSGSLIRET